MERMLEDDNPVWMEKRPYNKVFLSLDMLKSNEEAYAIIRKVACKNNIRRLSRTEADPIDAEFLKGETENVTMINTTEMWNAFKAQGNHLFAFIRDYPYRFERTLSDHIILYCQMATQHSDELRITEEYESYENIEYAIIYAS